MAKGDANDPKGLIAEAYRIDGIGAAECRSIFLDWALSLPDGADPRRSIDVLLARHGAEGHPMTAVLHEGRIGPVAPRPRRRSRRGRPGQDGAPG